VKLREELARGVGARSWREELARGVGARSWREELVRGVGARSWRPTSIINAPLGRRRGRAGGGCGYLPKFVSGGQAAYATPAGVGQKINGRRDVGRNGEAQEKIEFPGGYLGARQEYLEGHLRGENQLVALEEAAARVHEDRVADALDEVDDAAGDLLGRLGLQHRLLEHDAEGLQRELINGVYRVQVVEDEVEEGGSRGRWSIRLAGHVDFPGRPPRLRHLALDFRGRFLRRLQIFHERRVAEHVVAGREEPVSSVNSVNSVNYFQGLILSWPYTRGYKRLHIYRNIYIYIYIYIAISGLPIRYSSFYLTLKLAPSIILKNLFYNLLLLNRSLQLFA
jgi:hypothetical protein